MHAANAAAATAGQAKASCMHNRGKCAGDGGSNMPEKPDFVTLVRQAAGLFRTPPRRQSRSRSGGKDPYAGPSEARRPAPGPFPRSIAEGRTTGSIRRWVGHCQGGLSDVGSWAFRQRGRGLETAAGEPPLGWSARIGDQAFAVAKYKLLVGSAEEVAVFGASPPNVAMWCEIAWIEFSSQRISACKSRSTSSASSPANPISARESTPKLISPRAGSIVSDETPSSRATRSTIHSCSVCSSSWVDCIIGSPLEGVSRCKLAGTLISSFFRWAFWEGCVA